MIGCYVGTACDDLLHMQAKEDQRRYNLSSDLMIAN